MGLCHVLCTVFDPLISIHPSRVGWDPRLQPSLLNQHNYFNPPIPCGMGRSLAWMLRSRLTFQSTHPVWDGTGALTGILSAPFDFNPPIPCGMGQCGLGGDVEPTDISIHPSRVGWDSAEPAKECSADAISIHPSRVGWDLHDDFGFGPTRLISIHPSRVGWDMPHTERGLTRMSISIHPSRVGWDHGSAPIAMPRDAFQSTHPVWDGTRI